MLPPRVDIDMLAITARSRVESVSDAPVVVVAEAAAGAAPTNATTAAAAAANGAAATGTAVLTSSINSTNDNAPGQAAGDDRQRSMVLPCLAFGGD